MVTHHVIGSPHETTRTLDVGGLSSSLSKRGVLLSADMAQLDAAAYMDNMDLLEAV